MPAADFNISAVLPESSSEQESDEVMPPLEETPIEPPESSKAASKETQEPLTTKFVKVRVARDPELWEQATKNMHEEYAEKCRRRMKDWHQSPQDVDRNEFEQARFSEIRDKMAVFNQPNIIADVREDVNLPPPKSSATPPVGRTRAEQQRHLLTNPFRRKTLNFDNTDCEKTH